MANEIDNAGNILAYKWLNKVNGKYQSQGRGQVWENNQLVANHKPTETNKSGIYCSRHATSRSLTNEYAGNNDVTSVKVQIMLIGTVVEHDFGFRAEEAWIMGEVAE